MTDGEMKKNPYSLSSFLGFINDHFVPLLVSVLLIAGGFYGGSLWTENQLLKNGGSGTAAAGTGAAAAPAAAGDQGPTKDQLAKMPEVDKNDHTRGAKNPKVWLVEYSDYECPFCKQFHPTTTQVLQEFPNDVQLVFRHYPLPFHANAQKAAEAAECVAKDAGNEAFWKFTDLYFERTTSNGTGIAVDAMGALAGEAGANAGAVQKCVDGGEMAQVVKDHMSKGSTAGVTGTPGTFVVTKDGVQEIIPGALPYESVKATIEKYL